MQECWTPLLYTLSQSLRSPDFDENLDTMKESFGVELVNSEQNNDGRKWLKKIQHNWSSLQILSSLPESVQVILVEYGNQLMRCLFEAYYDVLKEFKNSKPKIVSFPWVLLLKMLQNVMGWPDEQDQAAVESHRRAAAASAVGKLKEKLIPVSTKTVDLKIWRGEACYNFYG